MPAPVIITPGTITQITQGTLVKDRGGGQALDPCRPSRDDLFAGQR